MIAARAGALSGTVMEAPGPAGATVAAEAAPALPEAPASNPAIERLRRTFSSLQVRHLTLTGASKATLTLPDGAGRVLVERVIGPSTVRMGGYYNFVTGSVRAWIGYGFAFWKGGPSFHIAGADDIGLGRVYLRTRSLERARSVPVGIGWGVTHGSFLVSADRTTWRLAPFDNPAAGEVGMIDGWGVLFETSDVIPDIVQSLRQEQTRDDTTVLRYRRAFRGMGGDWHFDRADVDMRAWFHAMRPGDEWSLRGFYGQAWNISPNLPLRETYALGGANALRGYRFEEFRGTGMLLFGAEYALRTTWKIMARPIGIDLHRADLVFFGETGRIQDGWSHGVSPFKWGGGFGVRFGGRMLRTHKSVFRLLVAQALSGGLHKPVFYVLADII